MPRHEEQKTLAYTADELFSVVADVKDYPAFVPWCSGAHIRRDGPQEIIAELEIGFGPFRRALPARSRWIDRDKCWCALLKGDRWST